MRPVQTAMGLAVDVRTWNSGGWSRECTAQRALALVG
jgi:hypothetical protein